MTLEHWHIKHVDELYGVATCLTCTALEARVVDGMLVHMYWGEGDCPGDRVDSDTMPVPEMECPACGAKIRARMGTGE